MGISIAAQSARLAGDAEQYLAALVWPLLRSAHPVAWWFETEGTHRPLTFHYAHAVKSWRASDDARGAFAALRAGVGTAATRFRLSGHLTAAGVPAEAVPA